MSTEVTKNFNRKKEKQKRAKPFDADVLGKIRRNNIWIKFLIWFYWMFFTLVAKSTGTLIKLYFLSFATTDSFHLKKKKETFLADPTDFSKQSNSSHSKKVCCFHLGFQPWTARPSAVITHPDRDALSPQKERRPMGKNTRRRRGRKRRRGGGGKGKKSSEMNQTVS